MKHFRYDIIGAHYYGVNEHPQTQMKNLGFHWVKSEPVPIADCWWFRCDEYPDSIPSYIDIMKDDFRFSDEYHK